MQREKNGGFFMEVQGRQQVILSGCHSLIAYDESCVGYRTAFGEVMVFGNRLELGCMTTDGATVSGQIQRIEFQ